MKRVWCPTKPLRFHDMGEGLLLVEFELHSDKVWVTSDGLWSFDKSLILMKDFDGLQQVKNIKMTKVSFWIRVYDLTLMACNEYIKG